MSTALKSVNTRKTAQTEQANERQVKNNAGGYVYKLEPLDVVRRFLILGVEGNTFYKSGKALARENAQTILSVAKAQPKELVDLIVEVSVNGLAPKQDATLFALAAASSVPEAFPYVRDAFRNVVRTGTHLFTFVGYASQFRGWGRGFRDMVASWYTEANESALGYQVVKYRQRNGYTHRDVLRLSHPKTNNPDRNNLLAYAAEKSCRADALPESVRGYLKVADSSDIEKIVAAIYEYNLSWEMIPSSALNDARVWQAFIKNGMPLGALLRQLPKITRVGAFDEFDSKGVLRIVLSQLKDKERIEKARIHPFSVLIALRTYAEGQSFRGSSSWVPNVKIVDALDEMFYLAFKNVEPANKRTMIALDVSGSMWWNENDDPVTPAEAAVAMSMITLATEEDVTTVAFSGSIGWGEKRGGAKALKPLALSARQRLDDAVNSVRGLPMTSTDCAAPILYALHNRIEIDTFIVYTDNETWEGDIHVDQALKMYRDKMGIDARLAVVAFTATEFTIGDPADGNVLNVAGLDSSLGALLADFSSRKF